MRPSLITRLGGAAVAVLAVPLLAPATAIAADDPPEPPTVEVPASEPVQVEREAGATRIHTAIEISQRAYETADVVVLARSDNYADALAGGPLAAALDAPLLLSDPTALPDVVLEEIDRLGPDDVVLLGGTGALGPEITVALDDAGYTVRRAAGSNRFETAADIADLVAAGTTGGTVFLVEGDNADPDRGWPDGVSVSAYAAHLGAPILPVVRDAIPAGTQAALDALAPSEIVLVGGTAAISADIEAELTPGEDEEGPTVRRLAGDSRYTTSAAVYDEAMTMGMSPVVKWAATGEAFPDALTAGATAGWLGQAMLLVPGSDISAVPASLTRLETTIDIMESVVLVGGTAAISATSESVVEALVAEPAMEPADFCLTVLHNNDGESNLVDAGSGLEAFGGADNFATRMFMEQTRANQARENCESTGVITVSSGDNFLAGIEFNASREKGVPFYDSLLLDYLNYDAVALGNHDFDFGPAVTADLIEGAVMNGDDITFLSANLEFDGSPLEPYVTSDDLLPSVSLDMGGHTVGVIGITPPYLRQISSPGDDIVVNGADAEGDTDLTEVAQIINDQAASMDADVLVVISHLQDMDEELSLVPMLDDVDIVVAGGGDEVLASPGELLVPGDHLVVAGEYPTYAGDVPVVTTSGNYKYIGRLVTRFDDTGDLIGVDEHLSRMVRVADASMPDGVASDDWARNNIVNPVIAYGEALYENAIATSEVDLDVRRSSVRTQETNTGDLVADAYIDATVKGADASGLDPAAPMVAFTNGGGLRADAVIPAGPISEGHTWDIAPFTNFVVAFEDVTVDQLDELLEHAYETPFDQAGQFAQLGNLLVDVDREADVGSRVSNHRLADGTELTDGFTLVTIDFLANGGDAYPFEDAGLTDFVQVGATQQQSLSSYLTDLGTITSTGYPEMGGYPEIEVPPTNAQRINFTDL